MFAIIRCDLRELLQCIPGAQSRHAFAQQHEENVCYQTCCDAQELPIRRHFPGMYYTGGRPSDDCAAVWVPCCGEHSALCSLKSLGIL